MIEKKPFRSYTLDQDKSKESVITITVKLNIDEQAQLVKDKSRLLQNKNSTAIKQLMKIGSKVLHDPKVIAYVDVILDNKRKNERR